MSRPQDRVLQARLAAHVRWSREDPKEGTRAARAAFNDRFTREVVEAARERDEKLTPVEIDRRAQHARKAYMTRLALKSAQSRAKTAAASPALEDDAATGSGRPVATRAHQQVEHGS